VSATEGAPIVGSASPRRNRVSELPALLRAVTDARENVHEERCGAGTLHVQVSSSRLVLHRALEAYAAAVATTGWPLPYRLRDELYLYRRLIRPGDPGRPQD